MRDVRRVMLALLIALVFSVPAAAQSDDSRVSFNAAVGPSFGNVGTTFATIAGVDLKLNDRTAVVGEFGVIPRAPFRCEEAPEQPAPPRPPPERLSPGVPVQANPPRASTCNGA